MTQRYALVDGQSFDLMEDGQMRGVVFIRPVDPPGTDDVDRQLASQHCPGLDRRRVGPQHDAAILGLDEQRVLHGACRMVRDEIERVEVEPLGLELRPLGNLPAHRDEHVLHQRSSMR